MAALEDEVGTELVPVAAPTSPTLFRTENPNEVVTRAAETANALAAVVKAKKLTVSIQGRDHVRVEGWTLLGAMLGVFPICTWTRKLENGWEARVEARTLAGQLVGAAEAQCLGSEKTWASRDDYALRSMAQTRATSKALRQPLGFVMSMAGFSATPAEEMIVEAEWKTVEKAKPAAKSAPKFDAPIADKKQTDEIVGLIAELDATGVLAAADVLAAMRKEYGTDKPAELSKVQAANLIERLRAKVAS
jgi:hypothetical protein